MEQGVLAKWIRTTAIGWLVGLVLVIVLAMAWEAIAGTAQFMVGIGMGAGVGFFQARLLKAWVSSRRRWVWISTIGMGLPFALWDVTAALGVDSFFSQTTCVLMGSLLVGVAQTQTLRLQSGRVRLWVPACVLGWGLPTGLMTVGQSNLLPGPWSIISVVTIFFGGIILGAVTGQAFVWMLQAESSKPSGLTQG